MLGASTPPSCLAATCSAGACHAQMTTNSTSDAAIGENHRGRRLTGSNRLRAIAAASERRHDRDERHVRDHVPRERAG